MCMCKSGFQLDENGVSKNNWFWINIFGEIMLLLNSLIVWITNLYTLLRLPVLILMSVPMEGKVRVVLEVAVSTQKVATNVFVKMATSYLQMETVA